MELRVIKYFLMVAIEGSVTAAARSLHLSQPTLTRQLHALEMELGVKLFIRGSHRITLTPAGRRFRQRAAEIAEMVGKIETEFAKKDEDIGGSICIGAGETHAMRHMGKILGDICLKHPAIQVHIQSGNQEDISSRLDDGLLDFCLLIQPADLSKYEFVTLPEKDAWIAIMSKNHPLAAKQKIHRDDLINERLILSRQAISGNRNHNEFLKWLGVPLDRLTVAATYNLLYNAAMLAAAELGIVLSLADLGCYSEEDNLCARMLEPKLEAEVYIAWRKSQILSPAASLFLNEIRGIFGNDKFS